MSKAAGERVVLHVYEPAKQSGPSIPGFGVYHTGIELSDSGVEWCYAGGPDVAGSGVSHQRAKQSPDTSIWKYRESIELGLTNKTAAQCTAVMRDVQAEYAARDYDIVHHNCNHFTADVAKRLGLKYPSHINRAATFGAFFLDNPIKDRQRKEAERKAEEERRRNVFANTTGHSLLAANTARPTTSAAASPISHTATSTSTTETAAATSASGGRRANPWADPSFFPGKGGAAAKPGSRK